jgi:hypothetical protein
MLKKEYRFLIRLVCSRYLQCAGEEVIAEDLATCCGGWFERIFASWAIQNDVSVLNYQSLQNLMPLGCDKAYFAAVLLDEASERRAMAGYVLKAAKRVFGIPEFHYCCIADSLTSIFMRYHKMNHNYV